MFYVFYVENIDTDRCNALQHTATHCNTTATHYNSLRDTERCNALQHTATHCNTLQHTATHCNILQHRCLEMRQTEVRGAWHRTRSASSSPTPVSILIPKPSTMARREQYHKACNRRSCAARGQPFCRHPANACAKQHLGRSAVSTQMARAQSRGISALVRAIRPCKPMSKPSARVRLSLKAALRFCTTPAKCCVRLEPWTKEGLDWISARASRACVEIWPTPLCSTRILSAGKVARKMTWHP